MRIFFCSSIGKCAENIGVRKSTKKKEIINTCEAKPVLCMSYTNYVCTFVHLALINFPCDDGLYKTEKSHTASKRRKDIQLPLSVE